MSKYKIGSTVKVVRNGKSYTRYREFYERHKTNKCFDYVKYALADRGATGVVMASGKHERESSIVYLVNIESIHKCILIGEDGIELLSEPIATPITAPNWVMVIRPDSTNPDKTIATLKLGKETVRTESVKRHYKDTYDRDAAIKAVVDKMYLKAKMPVKEVKQSIVDSFARATKAVEDLAKSFKTAVPVKEVKRHAENGEYIKIVQAYCNTGYVNGSILRVEHQSYFSGNCTIWSKNSSGKEICVADREYVVLENYTPPVSEVKEVSRPAKENEWIKVVQVINSTMYEVGDKLKVIYSNNDGVRAKAANKQNSCYLYDREYVVLENYKPDLSDCSTGAVGETVCEPVKAELPKPEPITINGVELKVGSKFILKPYKSITYKTAISEDRWNQEFNKTHTVVKIDYNDSYVLDDAFYYNSSAIDRIIED